MKHSLHLKPFTLHDSDPDHGESDQVPVNNLWLAYTGDYPDGIEPKMVMPCDESEVRDFADGFGFFPMGKGFNVTVSDTDDKTWTYPEQIHFATDHQGSIIAFEIPAGSDLKCITLEQLCELNRWDYRELKANCDRAIFERIDTV
jgi:hypothetical protein